MWLIVYNIVLTSEMHNRDTLDALCSVGHACDSVCLQNTSKYSRCSHSVTSCW